MIQVPTPGTSSQDNSLLNAALGYAAQGLKVFPLRERGKVPIVPRGHLEGTTDPDQIREWWGNRPEANIGVVAGGQLAVLDVDLGKGGPATLRQLYAEHGKIDTRVVRTGSGGLHLYLQDDPDDPLPQGAGRIGAGLDTRAGSKGYVVAPPSVHPSGDRYELVKDVEPAPVPDWLRELARSGSQASELAAGDGTIPEGQRNHALASLAGALRRRGLNPDAIEAALRVENRERCAPPLPEDEVRSIARSISRYAPADDYTDTGPSAQDEFEADPDAQPQVSNLSGVIGKAEALSLEELPEQLPLVRASYQQLKPEEQIIAEAAIEATITKRLGSAVRAQALLRGLKASSEGTDPFERVDGKYRIRAAQPQDLRSEGSHLVPGLIPTAAVGELIADFGCGKTWLLLHLGLSVAFGRRFFGEAAREAPVLYLAYEGQRGIWPRVAGWLYHHDLLPAEFTLDDIGEVLRNRFVIAQIPPRFDHPNLESRLRESLEASGAKLVIIDTRSKSLGLDQGEDSADTAAEVNGLLSRSSTATGCTFVSSHHTGHADRTRGRGSSGWTQGVDFSFLIRGSADQFAAGAHMILQPHKVRDGAWPRPHSFRLQEINGLLAEGTSWTSGVIAVSSEDPPESLSLDARIFRHITQNPGCSKGSVRNFGGAGAKKMDYALKRLLDRSAIENRGTPNRHEYHCCPGWRIGSSGDVEYAGEEFDTVAERPELGGQDNMDGEGSP